MYFITIEYLLKKKNNTSTSCIKKKKQEQYIPSISIDLIEKHIKQLNHILTLSN